MDVLISADSLNARLLQACLIECLHAKDVASNRRKPACVSMSVCGWVTSLTNLRTSPAHILQGKIDSVHPWLTCGSGAASLWLGSFKTGVRPPECHYSTQNAGWTIISGMGQI